MIGGEERAHKDTPGGQVWGDQEGTTCPSYSTRPTYAGPELKA